MSEAPKLPSSVAAAINQFDEAQTSVIQAHDLLGDFIATHAPLHTAPFSIGDLQTLAEAHLNLQHAVLALGLFVMHLEHKIMKSATMPDLLPPHPPMSSMLVHELTTLTSALDAVLTMRRDDGPNQ